MLIIIFITGVLLFLPLAFFLVAAVAEWRSAQKDLALFLRMGEIAGGIIFWTVHAKYWGIMRISSSSLSWTMVRISLLLGGLALVSKYESWVALMCVLLGSASLAFLWYFNGAYHAQPQWP
jgi:hypothetical protein